jgi:hypothetical protein
MRLTIFMLIILAGVNVAASLFLSIYAATLPQRPNMVYEAIGPKDEAPRVVCIGQTFEVVNHIRVGGTPAVVTTYSSWWSRDKSLPAAFESPRPDIITAPDEFTRTIKVQVPVEFAPGIYEWRQAAVDGYAPVSAISVPVEVITCP